MKKNKNIYKLHCEICNWTKVTNGSDAVDLVEFITAPIPVKSSQRDLKTKKIIEAKSIPQPRKFKCPKCGRLVIPKKLENNEPDKDWIDGSETGPERPQI